MNSSFDEEYIYKEGEEVNFNEKEMEKPKKAANGRRISLPSHYHASMTTTQRELSGFYAISVGVEGYSAIVISAFLPLVIQTLAANVSFTHDDHRVSCDTSTTYTCDVLFFNKWWIDTAALVLYCTSISVILQFILFIILGALADYGGMRKYFLLFFGITSALIGSLILLVWEDQLYWLACLIYIISNTLYGAIWVFAYAWVPILSRFDPRVQASMKDECISQTELYRISDHVSNEISSKGFMYGYFSVVFQLIVWCAFAFFIQDGRRWGLPETYPIQIAIAGVCFFQVFILLAYVMPRLPVRPGPSLPEGSTYIGTSISNLYKTLSHASRLSELFKFLMGWFIYSDSFTTVVSIAILFAQSTLGAPTTVILLCVVVVPLFAGIGNIIWIKLQRHYSWSSKKTLLLQAFFYTLLPLYGCLGFFTQRGTLGIQNKYELFPLAAYHGFLLGATQSTCRVLYSSLIPASHESQFFSLYELTDKGSSWVGPLVAAAITGATGTLRSSFIFLSATFILGILIFASIDIEKGLEQAEIFVETQRRLEKKK